MDALLAYDFATFIGGHANRTGVRRDIEAQKQYLQDVRRAAEQAYDEVNFAKLLEQTGWDRRWQLFGIYFDKLAKSCSDKIVAKWERRLGGAGQFMTPNCMSMAFSLWMD